MLRRLRGMVLDNFGLKLFALVLAVVMFRFVRGGQDQVAATEVKLLLKLPAKTLLVSDPVAGVRVTLRGAGSTLGSVTRKPLTYTLDLTNAEIGPSQYELYTDMFRPLFPPDVMVIRIAPSVLNIVLDHKSVRTVPVILRVKGKPAFGYRVVRIIRPCMCHIYREDDAELGQEASLRQAGQKHERHDEGGEETIAYGDKANEGRQEVDHDGHEQ